MKYPHLMVTDHIHYFCRWQLLDRLRKGVIKFAVIIAFKSNVYTLKTTKRSLSNRWKGLVPHAWWCEFDSGTMEEGETQLHELQLCPLIYKCAHIPCNIIIIMKKMAENEYPHENDFFMHPDRVSGCPCWPLSASPVWLPFLFDFFLFLSFFLFLHIILIFNFPLNLVLTISWEHGLKFLYNTHLLSSWTLENAWYS